MSILTEISQDQRLWGVKVHSMSPAEALAEVVKRRDLSNGLVNQNILWMTSFLYIQLYIYMYF